MSATLPWCPWALEQNLAWLQCLAGGSLKTGSLACWLWSFWTNRSAFLGLRFYIGKMDVTVPVLLSWCEKGLAGWECSAKGGC